jgi:hypothetical protein
LTFTRPAAEPESATTSDGASSPEASTLVDDDYDETDGHDH